MKKNYDPINDTLLLILLIFIISCLCNSCVTQQKLDPMVYYKKDVMFKFGKKTFYGIAVLPYQDKYEIKVKAHGDLDTFSLLTCHMEKDTANAGNGIFTDNRTTIKFNPSIEKEGDCPMYVSAFNKNKKHSWGFIAFEHPNYLLKATMYCNGEVKEFNGVSACGTRQGLKQRIVFKEKVFVGNGIKGPSNAKNIDCPALTSKDGLTFNFKLPNRECRYAFIGESGMVHTTYLFGHEDSIIRD